MAVKRSIIGNHLSLDAEKRSKGYQGGKTYLKLREEAERNLKVTSGTYMYLSLKKIRVFSSSSWGKIY